MEVNTQPEKKNVPQSTRIDDITQSNEVFCISSGSLNPDINNVSCNSDPIHLLQGVNH